MARNRELKGKKPLQVLCLANANDLGNPLFMELGLVNRADKMIRTNQNLYTDKKRGIMLIILQDSRISAAKRQTALYQLTAGSDYSEMAVANTFSNEEHSTEASRPLKEYTPVCNVGELAIYRHKSTGRYYCSAHQSGSVPCYSLGEVSKMRFRRRYAGIWEDYLADRIEFENYTVELLLTKMFK